MIFSSVTFIFLFLPVTLAVYYLIPDRLLRLRNTFLLLASLFFYWFGEPRFVFLMAGALIFNWGMVLWMDRNEGNQRKAVFIVIVAGDLSLLFVCKYLAFVVENLDRLPAVNIPVPEIVLPVGISFFTFQALSYVTDVFRTPGSAEKSLVNVALYISMFPQLIAGPIVRYGDVSEKIRCRRRDPDLFSWGVYRFIQGLGKKAIIANTVASAADTVFKVNSSGIYMGGAAELTPGLYWFALVALEKLFFRKKGEGRKQNGHSNSSTVQKFFGMKKLVRHCYIILVMLVGSVIFRSGTLVQAGHYLLSMWGFSSLSGITGGNPAGAIAAGSVMVTGNQLALFLLREYWYVLAAGAILSFPVVPAAVVWLKKNLGGGGYQVISGITMVLLMVISFSFVIKGGYSPFIYFQF